MILSTVAACSFHASEVPGDGIAPGSVTVGFASSATLEDETSGTLHLAVELSAAADTEVSVHYAITGGSATAGADYTGSDGTLTFSPGETAKTIDDLTILDDNEEESDETIELTLSNATGAKIGTATETVTINANVLPRVSLAAATSQADENASTTFVVSLSAPSPTPVVVPYTIAGGTATTADFALPTTGMITFAANDMTPQQLVLGVVDDALDEDDETVKITLGQTANAIIGTVGQEIHTIVDNDALPVVSFSAVSQAMTEGNTGATTNVTATISLTPVSGRDVTVTLTPTGTATLAADYTFADPTVTIPAGQTSATATVTVDGDVTDEPNETVVLTMTVPGVPHATLGANTAHTITINDDDLVCYGTGTGTVCFDSPPTGNVSLPASINTTNGAQCAASQPTGWTAGGQPAACFVVGGTISQSGTTAVQGTRPLVLVAATTITIGGTLDAASHVGGSTGPASPGTCKSFVATPGATGQGGGGGAGGSFMSQAGDGGDGDGGNNTRGVAASADAASPTVLRAGCDGQPGGGGAANLVGRGGGVVYLVAGTAITISGTINVSGSGAAAGVAHAGGAGAGAGGMIKLDATSITATGGKLVANGGGGASGGGGNSGNTRPGSDPNPATPLVVAAGGVNGAAEVAGGAGFAGVTQATDGLQGGGNNGGGGGGGAGGYVSSNLALTGATVSAGKVDAP